MRSIVRLSFPPLIVPSSSLYPVLTKPNGSPRPAIGQPLFHFVVVCLSSRRSRVSPSFLFLFFRIVILSPTTAASTLFFFVRSFPSLLPSFPFLFFLPRPRLAFRYLAEIFALALINKWAGRRGEKLVDRDRERMRSGWKGESRATFSLAKGGMISIDM